MRSVAPGDGTAATSRRRPFLLREEAACGGEKRCCGRHGRAQGRAIEAPSTGAASGKGKHPETRSHPRPDMERYPQRIYAANKANDFKALVLLRIP